MEDRISVSVSEFGSVTVDFFYYENYHFFVGADYIENADDVMERIEKKYLPAPNGRRLGPGFAKYRGEIRAELKDEFNGGK